VAAIQDLKGLSVLVTCYNKIEYVEKCFRALVEMENLGASIIIIDDGSTDGSSEMLLKSKMEMDSKIQVIRTANQGAGPARLLSIEKAETDFVFFLDIDDLPIVCGVQELLNSFKSSSADLAVGNYKVIQNSEIGLMPLAINNFETIRLKDYRQEFKEAMGWWRYIYKRNFLMQQHNLIGNAFGDFGDKKFVLDDLFWMTHLCAQDLEVLVSPNFLSVYEYNLPVENAYSRWNAYLKQVSYLPEAADKFLQFTEKNECQHNQGWLKKNTLDDIWNHMPLLSFFAFYKSYFASFHLTSKYLGGKNYSFLMAAGYLFTAIARRNMRLFRELQTH
jgi:glycosyltransferase involved in cell wall biosynthesis